MARDFAFVVDATVTAEKIIKAIKGADKALIRDVSIFDVYTGDKVEAGKKSLAINVVFQPSGRSFADADLEALSARITATVAKATGAVLRR